MRSDACAAPDGSPLLLQQCLLSDSPDLLLQIPRPVLMADPFRVYIGWDQREPVAYDVAKFSLERRASIPVAVTPIKLDDLRSKGLYHRDQDPLASTEFTYSRFLTPALAGFRGWALFCDCDFLWL